MKIDETILRFDMTNDFGLASTSHLSAGLHLRLARESDVAAIAHLHAASWRSAYRGMLSDQYLDGPVEAERYAVWHERLARPESNQCVIVVESAAGVCGLACAYGAHDTQWGTLLENIHVAQAYKRQGVGAGLMQAIAHWSASAYPGCGLHLWVLKPNVDAQQFYLRLGAKHVGDDVWLPPDGGAVPKLRFAWSRMDALL